MSPRNRQCSPRRRGTAMLLALFLIMIVGLATIPIFHRASFHHSNAFRETRYIASLHVAEAGIDEALWHLSKDRDRAWTGWDTSDPSLYRKPAAPLRDSEGQTIGEYEVTIADPLPLGTVLGMGGSWPMPVSSSALPTIHSVAAIPGFGVAGAEVRSVQVRARARTVFAFGLFSDQDMKVNGNPEVDSFDSREGPYGPPDNVRDNGDIGSNEDIQLNGVPVVNGDAGAGGSVTMGGGAVITGDVETGLPRVDLPSVAAEVEAAKLNNDNAGLVGSGSPYNSGSRAFTLNGGKTFTLPGGTREHPKIYYFSSMRLNGNSTLIVEDYAVIFTDGSLTFNGGTQINGAGGGKPEQLVILSSADSSEEIKINGGAGFSGAVYAPECDIKFAGGGDIYGAFIAGQIDMVGNSEFHYDEALGTLGPVLAFEVSEWAERYEELADLAF